jgi:urea ABC transporter ATP-binding protein UrtE
MLKITDLQVSYGGSLVLQGIDMEVHPGYIVALMGRNGVGKTTLMRSVVGFVSPRSGQALLDGKDITGMPPHQISKLGISYVPQGRDIFQSFTVYENLRLGVIKFKRKDRTIPGEIFDYFPILHERRNQKAGSFSGGEQQMLAIARALVSNPKILLLDEPSEGIQPSIVEEIGRILVKINQEKGVTILIVEQNVDLIMDIAKKCFFMEKGKIVDQIETSHLRQDDSLITQYLAL